MSAARQILPEPCPRCGWQYEQSELDACSRGEVRLDPLPTHFCRPMTADVACICCGAIQTHRVCADCYDRKRDEEDE